MAGVSGEIRRNHCEWGRCFQEGIFWGLDSCLVCYLQPLLEAREEIGRALLNVVSAKYVYAAVLQMFERIDHIFWDGTNAAIPCQWKTPLDYTEYSIHSHPVPSQLQSRGSNNLPKATWATKHLVTPTIATKTELFNFLAYEISNSHKIITFHFIALIFIFIYFTFFNQVGQLR